MNIIKVPFGDFKKAWEKAPMSTEELQKKIEKPELPKHFLFDEFKLVIEGVEHFGKLVIKIWKDNGEFEPMRNNVVEAYRYRWEHYLEGEHGHIEWATLGYGRDYEVLFSTDNNIDGETAIKLAAVTFWYLVHIDKEIKDRKQKKMPTPKRHTREYRKSCVSDRVYLMDDLYIYAKDKDDQEREHHEMLCPCWEVRGHYRHYKSGKVVFIKAFKKGKEKDKVSPKNREYYL